MVNTIFEDVMSRRLVDVYWHFGVKCCLQLQGRPILYIQKELSGRRLLNAKWKMQAK
jgi:hypothetical protein